MTNRLDQSFLRFEQAALKAPEKLDVLVKIQFLQGITRVLPI
jgi:hypothetical protein